MDGAQGQSLNGGTDSESAQRQVRLQLTTRHEDVALPENTGPILVPTGKEKKFPLMSRKSISFQECILIEIAMKDCVDMPSQP